MELLSKGKWDNLTDISLGMIPNKLGSNPIDEEDIKFLKKFPNLKKLCLSKTKLSKGSLRLIEQMELKNLRFLELCNDSLNIGDNNIKEEEIKEGMEMDI